MDSFNKFASALSRAGSTAAAIILVLMVGHILQEILLRNVFATSTFSMDEMVGYGVAALTYLALGNALKSGVLIRVDMIISAARGRPAVRRVIELICATVTLATFAIPIIFFWRSVVSAYRSGYTTGTMIDIPQWIPESVMLIGLVIFWLQLFAHLLAVVLRGEDALTSETQAATAE